MPNLRPRINSFNPFKSVQPVGGGGRDTFVRPDVDRSGEREAVSLLESVRDLSPSVNRYLDRSMEEFQRRLQSEADAMVEGLDPSDIRAQSEGEWEAYSKSSGVDNAWWKIYLDESAGRKMALSFSAGLAERTLEATDPHDPQAHFRILEEEKERAQEGLGFYARAEFDKASKDTISRQARAWADARENRLQAHLEASYESTLRGEVLKEMDPMRGGDVSLEVVMRTVQEEFSRSGNPGRGAVLEAVKDAFTVQAGGAESPEELDAVRIQAKAMLAALSEQPFGPDAQPLEKFASIELDALFLDLETQLEDRELLLTERGTRDRQRGIQTMRDYAVGVAAKLYNDEISRSEAEALLLQRSHEVAESEGVGQSDLYGAGLLTFTPTVSTLESGRFANQDNPDTVFELEQMTLSPEFDPGSFMEQLQGAKEDMEITQKTYGQLLRYTANGPELAIAKVAQGHVAPELNSILDRATGVTVKGFLDQIHDPAEQAEVSAFVARSVQSFATQERRRLGELLRASGAGNEQGALDEWRPQLAERVERFHEALPWLVRNQFEGSVSLDPMRLFRDTVQADRGYNVSRQLFIASRIEKMYAGREDDALTLLAEVKPSVLTEGSDNPVGDLAAKIAGGRSLDSSGVALLMFQEGEAAFMDTLYEEAGIDEPGVDVLAESRKAINRLRNRTVEAPAPPPAPAPKETQEDARKAAAEGGGGGGAFARLEAVAQAQGSLDAVVDSKAGGDYEEEARKRLSEAQDAFSEERENAWNDHLDALRHVSLGYSPNLGRPYHKSYRTAPHPRLKVDFRGGRMVLLNPPPVQWGSDRIDLERATKENLAMEERFFTAKLWTGITLEEMQAGKVSPYEGAPEEHLLNLDTSVVSPLTTPLYPSVGELEAASQESMEAWLEFFPGYSRESFIEAQRRIILERIPDRK